MGEKIETKMTEFLYKVPKVNYSELIENMRKHGICEEEIKQIFTRRNFDLYGLNEVKEEVSDD